MQKIEAKVQTFSEIWSEDKELVRLSCPDLEIDWDSQLPTQKDAYLIMAKQSKRWQNPTEPFQFNETSLTEVLSFLVPKIENVFGQRLQEKPVVEILPRYRYLPRINELLSETNNQFGYGNLCQSPPTMFHSPGHGILMMPEKYLVRVPKGNSLDFSVASADFDVMELTWDRPFFEEVLCEGLSYALLRQMRREWKKDYLKSMKAVGSDEEIRISSINEAVVQYLKENITRTDRNKWGLYVACEKIERAWQSRLGMNDYLGVKALSKGRKLAQVAMVDDISVQGQQEVYVSFNPFHPNNRLKQQRFNSTNQN